MQDHAGDPPADAQPTNCVGLVEAAVRSQHAAAKERGLDLQFDAREDDLVLRADRRALSRDLIDMLQRALRSNESGTIWVSVSRIQRDGRRLVEVRVASNAYTDLLLLAGG